VDGTILQSRSARTRQKVSQLLIDLGITRSHSRPRVSNDNPYSESQFRTTKYTADYPEWFDSLAHAREWMDAFITYYNHDHRHSGIGLHTPPPSTSAPPRRSATNEPSLSPRRTNATPNASPADRSHPRYPSRSGSTMAAAASAGLWHRSWGAVAERHRVVRLWWAAPA
jgi:hypothetical protein